MIPSRTFHASSIKNSMEWAKSHINDAPDGSLFLADKHEITRGRQERIWQSAPGQILLTLLLKPDQSAIRQDLEQDLNYLNMALSAAIATSLSPFNIGLKWPNDFIFENKKVGGILLQAVWKDNNLSGIIVGIAINGNNTFTPNSHLNAISLREINKSPVNLPQIQSKMLSAINLYYNRFINQEFKTIFHDWKNLQTLLGRHITIHEKSGEILLGHMEDVLENGNLLLKLKDNVIKEVPFCVIEQVEKT